MKENAPLTSFYINSRNKYEETAFKWLPKLELAAVADKIEHTNDDYVKSSVTQVFEIDKHTSLTTGKETNYFERALAQDPVSVETQLQLLCAIEDKFQLNHKVICETTWDGGITNTKNFKPYLEACKMDLKPNSEE